jgi:hypothetical protein
LASDSLLHKAELRSRIKNEQKGSAMADPSSPLAIQGYRIMYRLSLQPVFPPTVNAIRPSLLDLHLRGDCWIVARSPELYGLCFDNRPLVYLSVSPVDVSSLNMLVDRLRHRFPRRRRRPVAKTGVIT